MNHYFREIMRYVDRMGIHEWFWVLIAVIVVGVFCLRGVGSRSQH